MTKILPILTVTALTAITGLTSGILLGVADRGSSIVARTPVKPTSLSVSLPATARVKLKNGSSKSARLTNIDSRAKTVILESSGRSTEVKIQMIDTIELQGEVILKDGKPLIIRGDEDRTDPNRNKKRWQEPLQNFKIIDAKKGRAEVTLTSLSPLELRGIESVAKTSSFVVEKIGFGTDRLWMEVIPR
jgi:hypothetical protein